MTVSNRLPPRRVVEKTGMRGRYRWEYSVEWHQGPNADGDEVWMGTGGWKHTKSEAVRMSLFTLEHFDRVFAAPIRRNLPSTVQQSAT